MSQMLVYSLELQVYKKLNIALFPFQVSLVLEIDFNPKVTPPPKKTHVYNCAKR